MGDGWDEVHDLAVKYPHMPLHAVSGNSDFGSGPDVLAFNFGSKKFVITHGHRYDVKYDRLRICLLAEENEADVCMFGHTHLPELFYHGRSLMLNPGSISLPKGNYLGCYGVVDISESGVIEGRVMAREIGRECKEYRRIL